MKVIALCYSYYHLAQVLGLCSWLQSEGNQPNLFIFRGKFLDEFRINPAAIDFSILDYPAFMTDAPFYQFKHAPWAIMRLIIKSMSIKSPNIALVSPNGPHIGLLSTITRSGNPPDIFFSIEDGLGTYGTILHRAKTKARESKNLLTLPIYLFGEIVKQLLMRITTLRTGAITETMMIKPGWNRRLQISTYVKQTLSSGIFRYSGKKIPEKTVLFLSQPYVETGIIKENCYRQVIQAAFDYFDAQQYHFVVKPHPSERKDKYHGFSVCDFDGPVEALFGTQRESIVSVVSVNSTALVLAHRLFGLHAYRIQHCALDPIWSRVSDKELNQLLQECTIPLYLDN